MTTKLAREKAQCGTLKKAKPRRPSYYRIVFVWDAYTKMRESKLTMANNGCIAFL